MSRLCEEFPGRLPTEIFAEIRRLPAGFLDEVIEMRGFAATYHHLETAERANRAHKLPSSPMLETVKRVMAACVEADLAEAARGE